MYKIYQNKYSNNLIFNIIDVRYGNNDMIGNKTLSVKDSTITLSDSNLIYDNPNITYKLIFYLINTLTNDGLNNSTHTFYTKDIFNDLNLSKTKYIEASLNYLKNIQYTYKIVTNNVTTNIIDTYEKRRGYFKVTFSSGFIELLGKSRQYLELPKEVLKVNIKYYRHSLYITTYLFLHRRRNKGKPNESIISVKDLIKNIPTLPKYERLDRNQMQIKRSIITPLECNLNYIERFWGIDWSYTTQEVNDYREFITNKVTFNVEIME